MVREPSTPSTLPSSTGTPSQPPAAAEPGPSSGCQGNMSQVGDFCIDQYEAHVVELPGGTVHPFNYPVNGAVVAARSESDTYPQGYISQIESEGACKNAGKRLCTKAEWRRACMGPFETVYPYGDKKVRGNCNSEALHPLSILFGGDARRLSYDNFNDPRLNLMQGGLAKTGAFPLCTGPELVYDMVGNLHEWVIDKVRSGSRAGNGIFLGGFYSNRNENGPGCYYETTAHDPGYHDASTGFRCCMDPAK